MSASTEKIEVLVNDSGSPSFDDNEAYFAAIDQWAQVQCDSYIGYQVVDVSDVSVVWDEIGVYEFRDEGDALWFELRWC